MRYGILTARTILLAVAASVIAAMQIAAAQIVINDGSYATNTALNANATASGTLTDLADHDGVSFDFSYEVAGTSNWAGGIQFQSPGGLEQIWTQHRVTGFDTNVANFKMEFSAPVDQLSLRHGGLDVDDTVRVEMFFQGQPVAMSTTWFGGFTGGVYVYASTPNSVTLLGPGGGSADETVNEYRITLPSGIPVDEVRFTAAKLNQNNNNVTLAFYDFAWSASTASVVAEKTQQPLDAAAYALPGSDWLYTLSAVNTGTLPVDADTIFFVDQLPEMIVFYNGDYDGPGPALQRAGFDEYGSGLTFDPSSDIGFSSATTPPTSFSQCTYTPQSGYDEAVRHICFNPKGPFLNGTPEPEFSISFRVRVR